jgi:hypothetical protein
MPVYVVDGRGIVYEQLAEVDGFLWLRRLDDGSLDTRPKGMLVPYDPRPNKGETWKVKATGEKVIIVGRFSGAWYTVPYMAEDGPPSPPVLPLTPYQRSELDAIIKRARRREDVNPDTAPTIPPEPIPPAPTALR